MTRRGAVGVFRNAIHPAFYRGETVLMGGENLLAAHKEDILKKWFDLVVNTYPPDTARFLKNQKDPFSNPVGAATAKSLKAILDEIFTSADPKALAHHFDPIIRIRAVQSFTPSQALGFVFSLKRIIRETLGRKFSVNGAFEELAAVDQKIDRAALTAFDLYMQCREKIFDLRANESRNRFFKAFERAGLVTESPEGDPGRK